MSDTVAQVYGSAFDSEGCDVACLHPDAILEAPAVSDVHDLHAWTITSGSNAVSAHVVLDPGADAPHVLDHLCTCLSGIIDIEHSTFPLGSGGPSSAGGDRARMNAIRAALG